MKSTENTVPLKCSNKSGHSRAPIRFQCWRHAIKRQRHAQEWGQEEFKDLHRYSKSSPSSGKKKVRGNSFANKSYQVKKFLTDLEIFFEE